MRCGHDDTAIPSDLRCPLGMRTQDLHRRDACAASQVQSLKLSCYSSERIARIACIPQVCGTIRNLCARDAAQLYESEKAVLMQAKDAEQMLWKTVFYTVIEEFRRRIKAAIAQGQKGSEPLRKVCVNCC